MRAMARMLSFSVKNDGMSFPPFSFRFFFFYSLKMEMNKAIVITSSGIETYLMVYKENKEKITQCLIHETVRHYFLHRESDLPFLVQQTNLFAYHN